MVNDRLNGRAFSRDSGAGDSTGCLASGCWPVTTPVLRLFLRIRNMGPSSLCFQQSALSFGSLADGRKLMAESHSCASQIVAGIREIETLIDQRKIRNDIPHH